MLTSESRDQQSNWDLGRLFLGALDSGRQCLFCFRENIFRQPELGVLDVHDDTVSTDKMQADYHSSPWAEKVFNIFQDRIHEFPELWQIIYWTAKVNVDDRFISVSIQNTINVTEANEEAILPGLPVPSVVTITACPPL